MAEKIGRKISKEVEEGTVEFGLPDAWAEGSPAKETPAGQEPENLAAPVPAEADKAAQPERSPEFLELAAPKLPALSKGNRARLLIQSPNRLYFYWSIGKNPFHTLSRAIGHPGGYLLVLKLIDLGTGGEEIHPVDERGNWWFDVHADSTYRAEIGFYAVNRPYIRVLYSNTITTPRKSPSPRSAESAEWRVPAARFARVLDAAGFQRDAFDVALAGDDTAAADTATRSAFAQFTGRSHSMFAGIAPDELRYAMLALASGVSLAELRGLISERLFQLLSSVLELDADRALAALKERFQFDAEEFEIEEEIGEAVFGLSAAHFPKRLRRSAKPRLPLTGARQRGVWPVSSHTFGKF